MGSTRQAVRLANLADLEDIALHHPLPTEWPPPDTHIEYTGPVGSHALQSGGALLFDVVSDSGDLPAAGLWWTTLGNLVFGSFTDDPVTQLAISLLVSQVSPPFTGAATAYPVVLERNEGLTMRWIRTTWRGILGGGVEQFQFHLDLGKPGADPDLDDVACLALATLLGTLLQPAQQIVLGAFSTETAFTEVGAVTMEATSATDKDGKGGNMAQKFPTQWFMWPTGARPLGTEGSPSGPYEVATAVSLQTDYRGPSGRGRLYLPPPSVGAFAAGGVLSPTHVAAALTGVQQFVSSIMDATNYDALVVSPRRLVLHTITSINVGKVPDSQRRRRRSQDEARTSAPIPVP
jgi:hypothetical protein